MRFVNLTIQSSAFFCQPCLSLLPGHQSGTGPTRNLVPFEKPSSAIRIVGQPRGIAAHAAVHALDHEWVRKTHWPLHPVNSQRQRGTVRAVSRGKSYAIHAARDISQK